MVSLVERNGEKRSFHVPNVSPKTLRPIMQGMIDKKARLMTDEHGTYTKLGKDFASHEVVNHTAKEYARGDVTTNTVESSFALLKRGRIGTFHSVSEQHLQRYATEFDFRWNHRVALGINDVQRTAAMLKGIVALDGLVLLSTVSLSERSPAAVAVYDSPTALASNTCVDSERQLFWPGDATGPAAGASFGTSGRMACLSSASSSRPGLNTFDCAHGQPWRTAICRYALRGFNDRTFPCVFLTCSGFFEPIIPGGRFGWGSVDVAA